MKHIVRGNAGATDLRIDLDVVIYIYTSFVRMIPYRSGHDDVRFLIYHRMDMG